MVKFLNNFGKNLWCTYINSNSEWKKYKFLIFKVIKSCVSSKYTAQ